MKQLTLLAALICFSVAAIKLYTAKVSWKSTSSAAPNQGYLTLTPEAAKARLEQNDAIILLDVRSQEEYDGGHIPGAVCLPNEEICEDMPVAFDKDAEILVYCRSGSRSAQAAEKLSAMGYTNVSDFGGILSWPYETTTD